MAAAHLVLLGFFSSAAQVAHGFVLGRGR
jgi:hypothetical protein